MAAIKTKRIELRQTYKHSIFLFVLCYGFFSNAQTFENKLKGQVYSKDADVTATHVSNITAQRFAITDSNGFFAIEAKPNDTLVFSAVQFKRKEVVVTRAILQSEPFLVKLEEVLTELEEVVVTPYNLSGKLDKDLESMNIVDIITASTLELPNAYVRPPTQSERKLYTAGTLDFTGATIKLDPLMNYFSGRTKMLKKRVKRESEYARLKRVRKFYADSLYLTDLKIPIVKIDDFMYFCEVDSAFSGIVATHDQMRIWEFLRRKSLLYRENNALD